MPQEKTHTAVNFTSLIFTTAIILHNTHTLPPHFIPATLGFITSTLFLSPDIDIPQSTISKRWHILKFLWIPYQLLFKHRGISHNILLGPLTRILYLSIPLFLIHQLTYIPHEALYALLGIYLADFLHVLLDKL